MGLPNIAITFQALANSAVQRLARGTVGLVLRDEQDNGACTLTRASQAAAELKNLGANNLAYIERAFLGYVSAPNKAVVYVLPKTAADLSEALAYMAAQSIDYLAGPPDATPADIAGIETWIGDQRAVGATPKAVLPKTAADNIAIINFATDGIQVGGSISNTFSAAGYCSRIAGLIAGTPPSISCTYAPLPEVTAVAALSKPAMDAAIDAGQFIIFSDGAKVKAGRGVNSFQNLQNDAAKNDSYKKIKIVEIMDMINGDIRATAQDTYIGRYANSYDNKCLLISAINDYLRSLEAAGLLARGRNTVAIDTAAQEEYLRAQGVDISKMSEQDVKEANTGAKVFLAATVSILDAIEDITLNITV